MSKASKASKASKVSKVNKASKAQDRPSDIVIDTAITGYISSKVMAVTKLLKIIFDGYKQNVVKLVNIIVNHMSDYRFVNIHLLVFYNTIMYKANEYRESISKKVWNNSNKYNRAISNIDLLGRYYLNIYTQKSAQVAARQQRIINVRNSLSQFAELLTYISDIVNNYLVTIELDAVFAITADLALTRPVLSYAVNGRDISYCDTETMVVVSILLRIVLWQLSTVTLPRFFVLDIDAQLRRVSAYTLSKLIGLISNPRTGAQFALITSADNMGIDAEYIYIKKNTTSGTSYIENENVATESDRHGDIQSTADILTYTEQVETYFIPVMSGNKYLCKLCDTVIHKGNIVRHIESKGHKSNQCRDKSKQSVVK